MRSDVWLGDCLTLMDQIDDASVQAVITDLPYGTTSNKWDSVLPLDELWKHYLRISKDNAAFVFTSAQPFTTTLIQSNPGMWKHEWVWIKNRGSNFANTVREPFKEHETVQVFSRGKWVYNRQMQERTGAGLSRVQYALNQRGKSTNYREFEGRENTHQPDLRVPSSWQKFNVEVGLHPTQKPLGLMEYLVKTYTNEGDTVLDNCSGSGTTLLAARNLGRGFIGIEQDEKFHQTILERLGMNAS